MIKRNDVVTLKAGPSAHHAAKLRVLRKSQRTGSLTLEFLNDAPPYVRGDTIVDMPFNVMPAMETRNPTKE